MTMKCKVCSDMRRSEIDAEIVNHGNIARIAKKFDLNYNSVYHHSINHVPKRLMKVYEKKQMTEGFDLLKKVDSLLTRAEDIFRRNYDAKKDGIALKALDSQRNTIDLLAKISYHLHQAKILEAEQNKEQSGKDQQKEREAFAQKLRILNDEELAMYKKLNDKIQNQTKTTVIPDQNEEFDFTSKDFGTSDQSTQVEKTEASGEAENTDPEDMPRIAPIKPTQIRSTPWRKHPLNSNRR